MILQNSLPAIIENARANAPEPLRTALDHLGEDWQHDLIWFLRYRAPKLLGVVLLTIILIYIVRALTHAMVEFSKRQPVTTTGFRSQQLRTLASVINSVGTSVILFIALMQVLPIFGIDIKPLLASAGIVGLAVGFGAQTLVKDVINGFFILVENQYDIGDTVRLAGVTGTVEEMTLRHTILRDADGAVHTIPNSEIKVTSNLTRDWSQVMLHIAVDYGEDSDKVIKVLNEVAREFANDPVNSEAIVAAPEVPGIERVTGREVDYLMIAKVKPRMQFQVSRELRRRIKACFDKNGIKAADPNRLVVADSTKNNP